MLLSLMIGSSCELRKTTAGTRNHLMLVPLLLRPFGIRFVRCTILNRQSMAYLLTCLAVCGRSGPSGWAQSARYALVPSAVVIQPAYSFCVVGTHVYLGSITGFSERVRCNKCYEGLALYLLRDSSVIHHRAMRIAHCCFAIALSLHLTAVYSSLKSSVLGSGPALDCHGRCVLGDGYSVYLVERTRIMYRAPSLQGPAALKLKRYNYMGRHRLRLQLYFLLCILLTTVVCRICCGVRSAIRTVVNRPCLLKNQRSEMINAASPWRRPRPVISVADDLIISKCALKNDHTGHQVL